jgi:hypothetical protein
MVGDEMRPRKPRPILDGERIRSATVERTGAFTVGKVGGGDIRPVGTPRGLDSDEISLLYENRYGLGSNAIALITG